MLQSVVTPKSLGDLSKALLKSKAPLLMAGGTTIMPLINSGDHYAETLISLSGLGLSKIAVSKKGIVSIGAAATISSLAKVKELQFLWRAIEHFASPTLRNMATVGGNLFVAQPYGDFSVCLIALGATATLSSGKAKRKLSVEDVVQKGVKRGEIVTKVSFPLPAPGTFRFIKAARRTLNTPAMITVASVILLPAKKGGMSGCRVALGGVVPFSARAKSVEKYLEGKSFTADVIAAAAEAAVKDIRPADDAFASAWYRTRITPVYVRRALLGE
jgi:CO/xanthine dehydrogenase FAD-binding subunit